MVYCSFGSQAAGYSEAAIAFRCLGETFSRLPAFQFVLVLDEYYHSTLDDFADNVVIVKSAPQLELLERAAAFVTHGGLGGIKEAILARVPMIVIPFAVDQPANAKRVEYHRLGYACLPQECSPGHLARLLEETISNPSIRSSLKDMSDLFHETEKQAPILKYLAQLVGA